jgi:predicted Zn finger-like uncharacterized protein
MDITCMACRTVLKVPDEKLPPNNVVTITCPKCKGKMRIDTRELRFNLDVPKGEEFEELGFEHEEDTSPLEFFEEGTKLALVLSTDDLGASEIIPALEELSYRVLHPTSVHEAMGKLRLHHFDLIMLSDGFDGKSLEESPITSYLNHLSISIRRKILLIMLSDRFKTMDNMMAFAFSANFVVNPADLSNITPILRKATSDNEKFYKVFMDTLKEVGKE